MRFFFPQWQGSGSGKDILTGAKTIKKNLNNDEFITIPLSKKESILKNDINSYNVILEQLSSFRQVLLQYQPVYIQTIGGDCGLEIIPISYLASQYKNFGVIWFDAHADINSPKESPSHNFHGMPLRILLGEDSEVFNELLFSNITPSQIHYIGLRNIDTPEQEKIVKDHIYAPLTIHVKHLVKTLKNKKIKHLYIHFDLDCLDPKEYSKSYYKVSNGLSIKEAENCLIKLKTTFKVVGSSILESTATHIEELQPIKNIINLIMHD